jgi:hypothetical protein
MGPRGAVLNCDNLSITVRAPPLLQRGKAYNFLRQAAAHMACRQRISRITTDQETWIKSSA